MSNKITESEVWNQIGKLSLSQREHAFDQFASNIEKAFDCKIVDRAYGDLGKITNPVMPVQDNIRNICYLKEFVPNTAI